MVTRQAPECVFCVVGRKHSASCKSGLGNGQSRRPRSYIVHFFPPSWKHTVAEIGKKLRACQLKPRMENWIGFAYIGLRHFWWKSNTGKHGVSPRHSHGHSYNRQELPVFVSTLSEVGVGLQKWAGHHCLLRSWLFLFDGGSWNGGFSLFQP